MKRLTPLVAALLSIILLAGCGKTVVVPSEESQSPELSAHLVASGRPSRRDGGRTGLPAFDVRIHSVYMSALEDGLFHPDDPMTRGEACRALYTLMATRESGECSFSDLDPDDPCYAAVACLTGWHVISDSEGAFNPDGMLSRAQLLTMLMAFYPPQSAGERAPSVGSFLSGRLDIERLPKSEMPPFSDIASHWAREAIEIAVARGWIEPGFKYYPDAAVTRGEFCHIVNTALDRHGDAAAALLTGAYDSFEDVTSDNPYYEDILEAANLHQFTYDLGREYWPLGDLEPGFHRISGRLYYVLENGTLFRDGNFLCWHFDESGRYTTGDEALDGMVEATVRAATYEGQTPEQMLQSVYSYMKNHYSYHRAPNLPWIRVGDKNFENAWAKDLYSRSYSGNCIAIAAGFALAARALGFPAHAVYAYYNNYYALHAWVVIPDGGVDYMYDMEQERACELKDYALYHSPNYSVREYHYEDLYGSFAEESLQLPGAEVPEAGAP